MNLTPEGFPLELGIGARRSKCFYDGATVRAIVACGAVYFQQLDRGSRHASAYVTTTASVGPGYVTTGSFRVAQWSRSATFPPVAARWPLGH